MDQIYFTKDLLGSGSFAEVYKIEDKITGDFYAAKIAKKFEKLLKNEIEIHSKLSHQNIISYIKSFTTYSQENKILYGSKTHSIMILELGIQSLEKIENISQSEAIYITYSIAKGLLYLKSQNIIHRDLKPSNIILCNDKIYKICDFGLSIKIKENETVNRFIGSANYISPEIILRKNYSFDVDVWSLGVILYFLITGLKPFEGTDFESTFENITEIKYDKKNISSLELFDLLNKIFVYANERIQIEDIVKHDLFKDI